MARFVLTYAQIDLILQWSGTALILLGHILTSVGPETWPYNVFCFFCGAILFLFWAVRVRIPAQIVVNAASIVLTGAGVVRGIWSLL
jgi:hypothetical protein